MQQSQEEIQDLRAITCGEYIHPLFNHYINCHCSSKNFITKTQAESFKAFFQINIEKQVATSIKTLDEFLNWKPYLNEENKDKVLLLITQEDGEQPFAIFAEYLNKH